MQTACVDLLLLLVVFVVSVRLAGESSLSYAGRLEVYFDCVWGTVCDDYFDNFDAEVACFMLGFG